MDKLPIEILVKIFEYLTHEEILGAFWTCKGFAEAISISKLKHTSKDHSTITYMTNIISKHTNYYISSMPTNKIISKLLANSLANSNIKTGCLEEWDFKKLLKLGALQNVNSLDLYIYIITVSRHEKWLHDNYGYPLKSMYFAIPSELGRIKKISIKTEGRSIDYINDLEHTEELELNYTTDFKNVGNMPKLRKLIIKDSSCGNDYSHLTSLTYLKTGTHHTENLILPPTLIELKLTDIFQYPLDNIPLGLKRLSLNAMSPNSNIILPELDLLEDITIKGHSKNINYEAIKNVRNIKFKNIKYITNISELLNYNWSNLTSLQLIMAKDLSEVVIPKCVTELIIDRCENIDTLNNLHNLKLLSITTCHALTSISNIGNIDKLIISDNQILRTITEITNTKDITISKCTNLRSLTNWYNITNLSCSDCNSLNDISGLISVMQEIHLNNTRSILNYGSLTNRLIYPTKLSLMNFVEYDDLRTAIHLLENRMDRNNFKYSITEKIVFGQNIFSNLVGIQQDANGVIGPIHYYYGGEQLTEVQYYYNH